MRFYTHLQPNLSGVRSVPFKPTSHLYQSFDRLQLAFRVFVMASLTRYMVVVTTMLQGLVAATINSDHKMTIPPVQEATTTAIPAPVDGMRTYTVKEKHGSPPVWTNGSTREKVPMATAANMESETFVTVVRS